MLLILGGTTEGRRAAEVCEQAAQPYFYSTLTGEQDINLVHGTHVSGGMDADALAAFCRQHGVRLIVDAAHPFATQLHATVAAVARRLAVPVVRYERCYPARRAAVHYVDGMDELVRVAGELGKGAVVLSTLGVKSIAALRRLDAVATVYHRILPRRSSIEMAARQGADSSRLCFYHADEPFAPLLESLRPAVMLLKESGTTGGMEEKVAAALERGVAVVALCRPVMPHADAEVNGPHGLRRAIEHLLPDFFHLRSGLTTGTCATAVLVAAVRRALMCREDGSVPVRLPDGETIEVAVGYAEGYAYVEKEHSDDPDVTRGIELRAAVVAEHEAVPAPDAGRLLLAVERQEPYLCISVYAGEGIGHFTTQGFDYPSPSPAVNRVPRQMMRDNLSLLLAASAAGLQGGRRTWPWRSMDIIISIPQGAEVARRTFNPRLGIEGGLSIIGVSGIVMPYSEAAFVDSIRRCVQVAREAAGRAHLVLGSGAKSERALRAMFPRLPATAFVQYGNYVGATLRMAAEAGFERVTIGIMLGKAVKLAAGELDTHSRRTVMDKAFIRQMLEEAQVEVSPVAVEGMTLARQLWDMVPPSQLEAFTRVVESHCLQACRPLVPQARLSIVLIREE